MHELALRVCDRGVGIGTEDHDIFQVLTTAFAGLIAEGRERRQHVRSYTVDRFASGAFRVCDSAGPERVLPDASALVYFLDKEITLGVQRWRPGLFFVHAAALAYGGQVAILTAPSGGGKSTLAFALTQEGFGYLSDELAPLDFKTFDVFPYARALCLKALPPAPYAVPENTIEMGTRFYVLLPRTITQACALPLGAVFVLRRLGEVGTTCRELTAASAASHLMANGLNLAAHSTSGLDVAIAIAQQVPGFELDSSDLRTACSTVKRVLSQTRNISVQPAIHGCGE